MACGHKDNNKIHAPVTISRRNKYSHETNTVQMQKYVYSIYFHAGLHYVVIDIHIHTTNLIPLESSNTHSPTYSPQPVWKLSAPTEVNEAS